MTKEEKAYIAIGEKINGNGVKSDVRQAMFSKLMERPSPVFSKTAWPLN
jgi:hypothetical protein